MVSAELVIGKVGDRSDGSHMQPASSLGPTVHHHLAGAAD